MKAGEDKFSQGRRERLELGRAGWAGAVGRLLHGLAVGTGEGIAIGADGWDEPVGRRRQQAGDAVRRTRGQGRGPRASRSAAEAMSVTRTSDPGGGVQEPVS